MKSNLLCVISALFMAVQAQPPNLDVVMPEIINNCRDENNVSEQELALLAAYKISASHTSHNVKCHLKCVMEKLGFYKNNKLDERFATKYIKDRSKQFNLEYVKDLIQKCSQMKGADACDTASQMLSCFNKSEVQIMLYET